jgi:hypothetical protein
MAAGSQLNGRALRMLTPAEADALARRWIEAWNDHDLERILAHYADGVVFSSPFVQQIGASPSGTIVGTKALRAYFTAALDAYPTLSFRLHAVFRGIDSVTLLYESVNGLLAAETLIVNEQHHVSRVLAQYVLEETSYFEMLDTEALI